MSRSESLAAYLRAQARRRLDRVESNDGGRNARTALALLDAALYADGLTDDDALIRMLEEAGCFGPQGGDGFDPGPEGARLIRDWQGAEPYELLLALPGAMTTSA
ncbi:hypothetical protein ACWGH8_24215 [Nonomuraea muscovyensis]|uniref:Uncharacterized protein n=1 Tax=Nonomuraea muscovyensis TaxID=1124761 RepID=A0A7X0C6K8_9ACTN|nr:hypothetical protein [Nonomuraea muscovyensis]MBB6349498.1 hypothetical protein [Nonomuraea muscovyensis]MDF2709188.1 hypothetical protein [Nonomuraea muscovyensis]